MKFNLRDIILIAVMGGILLLGIPLINFPGNETASPVPGWEQLTVSSVEALKVGDAVLARQLCNKAIELVNTDAPDIRLVKTYMLLAEIYRWEEKPDMAEKTYNTAINVCQKISGPNHPDMVIPLESLANFYYFTLARYDKVVGLYERMLTIVENSPRKNDREIIIRANNLANAYRLTLQHPRAGVLYDKILKLAGSSDVFDKEDIIQYLLTSTDFYLECKKCNQAETLAKRALQMRDTIAGTANQPDQQLAVSGCLDALGSVYLQCGHPGKAEYFYNRSLLIKERIMGAAHPDLATGLTALGEALTLQKKYSKATACYKRALTVTEKGLGPHVPEMVPVLKQYAGMLSQIKKTEEAKAMMAKADSILKL